MVKNRYTSRTKVNRNTAFPSGETTALSALTPNISVHLTCTFTSNLYIMINRIKDISNHQNLYHIFHLATNQNDIRDEIKSRLNSGNACYYSVQNLLSSHLISKNLNIKIHKTVILPVVLYGRETWSLTLREEHRLRVCENSVEEDIWT
jgi:hypothetical protein